MVGSDFLPGCSGALTGSPERPRKRKSGAAAEDASPRRATRSSASSSSAQVDVAGAVAWARRAAAGELWAVRGRNRGIDLDFEPLGAVILAVRHARSEPDPDTPYSKKPKRHYKQGTRSSGRRAGELSHLSGFLESTRKRIGIDPVTCQAAIPEYNEPSEDCKANYRNDTDTLQRMGTVVRLPPIVEPPKTRRAVDDKCNCSHPGSEACVEVHVKDSWKRVKYQLGEQVFRNCGFGAMGERVLKIWTAEEKKKLADIEKSIPQRKSSDEDFMKVALKQFSSERTTDLAKYYYNVFLPRRLASLNRTEATNSIDASPDDQGNNQDDGNKVHHSEEKSKGSGSSSKSEVTRKRDSALIREPPKHPSVKPGLPWRSRRLAAKPLSRLPASKRGEVLIMQRMGFIKCPSAPSTSGMAAYDKLNRGGLTADAAEKLDKQPPLIREPPKQPPVKPWLPWRSRRLAAKPLSRVPASKRGEVLIMQRMGFIECPSTPSTSALAAYDKLYRGDLTVDNTEKLDELFPAVRPRRRKATS